jgi:type II secretory pathway pseudopilin PulG
MMLSGLAPKGPSGPICRTQATPQRRPVSEAGDTLIEVVLAVIVIAITAAALLGAITTSIVSSSAHRNLVTDDTLLRSYAEYVQFEIEQQPTPLYQQCATLGPGQPYNTITPDTTYIPGTTTPIPSKYQLAISNIQYWGGTGWVPYAACSPSALDAGVTRGNDFQRLTLTVTAPTGIAENLDIIVRNPNYVA